MYRSIINSILYLLIAVDCHKKTLDGNPCVTPLAQPGHCVIHYDCPDIDNYYKRMKRPWSPLDVEFLRKYTCGFERKSPKFCCPELFMPISQMDESSQTIIHTMKVDKVDTDLRTSREKNIDVRGYNVSKTDADKMITLEEVIDLVAELDSDYYDESEETSIESFENDTKPTKETYLKNESISSNVFSQDIFSGFSVTESNKNKVDDTRGESSVHSSGHKNLHLLPEDCGYSAEEDRVTGGNTTGIFEYPWMALVSYKNGEKVNFGCGGTIINQRYILTAAHCVSPRGAERLSGVRVGEHDLRSELDCGGPGDCAPKYRDLGIEQVVPHPGYVGFRPARQPHLQHDLALIRVDRDITYAENVAAICLPVSEELRKADQLGRLLQLAGWGVTEHRYKSPVLLKASVPVVPNQRCQDVFGRSLGDRIGPGQICAGGAGGADSCGGDSGGPLKSPRKVGGRVVTVQFGIVSFGQKDCGKAGSPAVYTRVAHYMDWILDHLKP